MISYPSEEQTTETLAVSHAVEIIEVPVIQTQEKTRRVANTLEVHRKGSRDPCCGAETDFHGDCSEEHRDSPVAIL